MDWSYLAGFTDGDGCICYTNCLREGKYNYRRFTIRWNQKKSDSFILDEIFKFLKPKLKHITDRNFSVATQGHKYPQRELAVNDRYDIKFVLENLLPYLIIKKEKAKICLSQVNYEINLKSKYGYHWRKHLNSDKKLTLDVL